MIGIFLTLISRLSGDICFRQILYAGICIYLPLGVAAQSIIPYPGFTWNADSGFYKQWAVCIFEVSSDVCVVSDSISAVTRYVSRKRLAPASYTWEVVNLENALERYNGKFTIGKPRETFTVKLNSDIKEIDSIIRMAQKHKSARIEFEKGIYHFYPTNRSSAIFTISNLNNTIIDGNGSTFIIHNRTGISFIEKSQDLLIENFKVDYDPVPYIAAKIIGIDKKRGSFNAVIQPGHPLPETDEAFLMERKLYFVDKNRMGVIENGPILMFSKGQWIKIGYRVYEITLGTSQNGSHDIDFLDIGQICILAPRGPAGHQISNSDRICLQNIESYAITGIGVEANYTDDLRMLNIRMLRKKGRYLGVQNGGTNIHNAKVGPWLENCVFESTGDDNNHVNTHAIYASSQLDPQTIIVKKVQPFHDLGGREHSLSIGDRLLFYNWFSSEVVGENSITKLVDFGSQLMVRFEHHINGLIPAIDTVKPGAYYNTATQIFNLERSGAHFVFRGNKFSYGRRIGILCKGGNGLVENNVFEYLGEGGVDIWNAPHEGPFADGVLIINNLFKRCGISRRRHQDSYSLWIKSIGADLGTHSKMHKHISIKDNVFIDYYERAISVNDAKHVNISGNTFMSEIFTNFRGPQPAAIEVVNTQDVHVKENVFLDQRLTPEKQIRINRSKNVTIE